MAPSSVFPGLEIIAADFMSVKKFPASVAQAAVTQPREGRHNLAQHAAKGVVLGTVKTRIESQRCLCHSSNRKMAVGYDSESASVQPLCGDICVRETLNKYSDFHR